MTCRPLKVYWDYPAAQGLGFVCVGLRGTTASADAKVSGAWSDDWRRQCCRYRNKPNKVLSAGMEAAFMWSSLFLCFAVICFGPIVGVVAAGLISG